MSATGANTPANHFGGSFGPNEWLVQEMYERYQQDPQSVDKSWWDFFADFKGVPISAFAPANGSSNGISNGTTNSNGINNVSSAGINNGTSSQRGVPPIPKQVLKQTAQAQSNSAQINSAQVTPVQSGSNQSEIGRAHV